jgi:tetratricopeptide (TPR) repeat protein
MRVPILLLFLSLPLLTAQEQGRWRPLLAERRWQEAELALRQELQERESVEALSALATVYRATGRLTAADPLLERLAVLEETVMHLEDLARVKVALGQPDRAEELYRRALALRRESNEDPAASISTRQRLAEVLASLSRFEEAEREANNAVSLRTPPDSGPPPSELAADLALLARLYQSQRKYQPAAAIWERALEVQEIVFGLDDGRLAGTLDNLATCFERLNDWPAAEQALRRALAIREANRGPAHPEVAQTLDRLGQALYTQESYAQAEGVFRRSLTLWTALLGPNDPNLALNYDNLAVTLASQGNYQEAERLYLESLKLRDREDVTSLRNLAVVRAAREEYAAAEPLYRRAVDTLDDPHHGSSDLMIEVLGDYADLLGKLNRPAEATRVRARLRALTQPPPAKGKAPPLATKQAK